MILVSPQLVDWRVQLSWALSILLWRSSLLLAIWVAMHILRASMYAYLFAFPTTQPLHLPPSPFPSFCQRASPVITSHRLKQPIKSLQCCVARQQVHFLPPCVRVSVLRGTRRWQGGSLVVQGAERLRGYRVPAPLPVPQALPASPFPCALRHRGCMSDASRLEGCVCPGRGSVCRR